MERIRMKDRKGAPIRVGMSRCHTVIPHLEKHKARGKLRGTVLHKSKLKKKKIEPCRQYRCIKIPRL